MARLTVRALESLKPKSASYKVTVDRDLYMRVAVDGTKTWLVRYVIAGRQIQVRLPRPYGSNGADGHMSLAQAVAENVRIQALAHDGIDFQLQRAELEKAAKLATSQAETLNTSFRVLFDTWLTDGVSREDGNAELRRTFDKDILPTIGDLPVREVNDGHLLELLRKVGRERGRGRTAERMLSECRQMYGWAIKRQPWRSLLTHGNPAELVELKQVVTQGYEPGIRERTLSVDELRELRDIFLRTTEAYEESLDKTVAVRPLQLESQLALWICLGVGCRIGELLKARWEDVNLENGIWFVPKANTKTKVDWTVFMSGFALCKFQALYDLTGTTPWCFPATQKEDMHVCVKTVSKQVGDRQMRFKKGKALMHRRLDDTLVLAKGKNEEWTPHDLRRTASTMMQALGVHPDVIDRCQNHIIPGSKVRRHYLHYDYANEKRAAWDLLGRRIDAVLSFEAIPA